MPTELDIAKAIRDGELLSPQQIGNSWLFAMRITGTGTAYRRELDEFVIRDPAIFLSDEFLERCNGLPVVVGHPEGGTLNSDEFARRAIGTVILPYVLGDCEVWGIARIFDDGAAQAMRAMRLSTSPAVALRRGDSTTATLKDGRAMLIEGEPVLLDHLAICAEGVWDKGEGPSGIAVNEKATEELIMADENKGGELLDKLLSKLDDCLGKMDDMGKRLDALESGHHLEGKGYKPRAQDDDDDHEATDPAYHNVMADLQMRADNAFAAWGERAPRSLDGETPIAYRKRLLGFHKKHSARYKDADLSLVTDPTILGQVEAQIYADSAQAAVSPESVPEGMLRMVTHRDDNGCTVRKFYGHPSAWMSNWMGGRRKYVTKIDPKGQPA